MSLPNPISLAEMMSYMELKHITGDDDRMEFVQIIRSLDRVFINIQNDRASEARRRAELKAKQQRSR